MSDSRPNEAAAVAPSWLAQRIELRPVAGLIPYARNPRSHSEAQVSQIAASIREFGFTNPVLVDRHGGLIAGHGRLMAARLLGLQQVPVLVLDHLSDAQKRAYVIADNQLALMAGWNEELLALELKELQDAGYRLELTGFAQREIDRLLAELEGGEAGSDALDAAPEPPATPCSRAGDLWLLGPHRLVCGDATDAESYRVVLDGGLADMVFTDPPYNVDYRGSATDRREGRDRPILNDALGQSFEAFLRRVCQHLLSLTKGSLYICMASAELHRLQRAFVEAGGHWSTFIIWAKNNFTLGRSDYQRQYEPILYGWKQGTDRFWCGDRGQSDVWFVNRTRTNDLHPTMKPVELVARAIRNSSKTRDTILDPFAGAGSTLIAAETTGRQAGLIELDPAYCDVICERWEDHAGKPAVLAATGQPFADVEAQRGGGDGG
ncbi:MAG: site-specific DNA-methyltransferase [Caldilineales bacterium]|nr:site-specific DNA-methyltransferase [Caldilineales bacterium]